jgi:pimeloyl-ACP methyl ester carboxylesterase
LKRRWKILIAVLVGLAILLVVNTLVVDSETKDAATTIDGGQIISLPGGDVQVLEEGTQNAAGAPIVLIHCYSCSLHWWDALAPILAENHRVIRIDLLGHGGSQKPSSGYSIDDQAGLVAGALDQLNVQGAVVVGHSLGFAVATAVAARASQLVDRLVNIDEGPSENSCSLPFTAKLSYVPVIGEALWRVTPDFVIEDGYADAFAPGYDVADGFPNPDEVVDDFHAMTYTAFKDAFSAETDYVNEATLDQRLRQIPVPLLSIFGSEDQICDPELSQAAYAALPGAQVAEVKGAGHSPNVEKPEETAALIEEFAADAGGASIAAPPRTAGQKPNKPNKPTGTGGTSAGKRQKPNG